MAVDKRAFLAGAAALAVSSGVQAQGAKKPIAYGPQQKAIPHGMVKTTKLFKYPPGYGNGAGGGAGRPVDRPAETVGRRAQSAMACPSPPICAKPPGWWTGTASCSRR